MRTRLSYSAIYEEKGFTRFAKVVAIVKLLFVGDWKILKIRRFPFQNNSISKSLMVLSKQDRHKIFAVILLQTFMGILDLLGVLAIGLLGALSITGLQSQKPISQITSILNFLDIANLTFQLQVSLLATSAVLLLVGRTIVSIFFTRKILHFLSRRGALISSKLISQLLSQPLLTIQKSTSQEILFAVTSGVSIITLQILGTAVVLAADISLLIIMAFGLIIVDPATAIATFLIFTLISFILYRTMTMRARSLGTESSELVIVSNEKILEVLSSYRESLVGNRRDYYAREIRKIRLDLADTSAEISFMPYISKYVIETSIVIGALLIAATQFILQDATQAISTLAIFVAAGSRIAPAVLRIQQGSIQIINSSGWATPTFDLIEVLGNSPQLENTRDELDIIHSEFIPEINLAGISLTYPGKSKPAVFDVDLKISEGASVAIVGPSGGGKTTLIDILLGVLRPDEGTVLLSGVPPLTAITKWPGAISYVPQDVFITSGTIRENVSLGYPSELITEDLVMWALRIAHLDQFVSELPSGLNEHVGERGAKLSGGQRQRLGIARAMFTRPRLLVLDEATSSLDGETEASISDAILELRGSTTVVMIAHRLSTVKNADMVVYLSEGKVVAQGTFDEVRKAVPDFDHQARLMSL